MKYEILDEIKAKIEEADLVLIGIGEQVAVPTRLMDQDERYIEKKYILFWDVRGGDGLLTVFLTTLGEMTRILMLMVLMMEMIFVHVFSLLFLCYVYIFLPGQIINPVGRNM